MKRRLPALTLILVPILLASCYPGTQLEVVNNTGRNLTVISIDTELKETAYSMGVDQSMRVRVPYKLRVQSDGEIWNYDLPTTPPPQAFRKRVRGNRYLEKIQIEKDGKIKVLLPDSEAPTISPPPQPSGYAILPK